MSETNTPPLSQTEIDALITFLDNNKDSYAISGDTLSQSSINKLIDLVKAIPTLDKNVLLNTAAINASSFFKDKNNTEGYELNFNTSENGQINIFAYNPETKNTIEILPKMLSTVDVEGLPLTWGICMSPNTFHRISELLELSYSEETFKQIIALFTEKMYGNADVTLPAFYLP